MKPSTAQLVIQCLKMAQDYAPKTAYVQKTLIKVIAALEADIAQPVEPAGYFVPTCINAFGKVTEWAQVLDKSKTPLYTAPQEPAGWQPKDVDVLCESLHVGLNIQANELRVLKQRVRDFFAAPKATP